MVKKNKIVKQLKNKIKVCKEIELNNRKPNIYYYFLGNYDRKKNILVFNEEKYESSSPFINHKIDDYVKYTMRICEELYSFTYPLRLKILKLIDEYEELKNMEVENKEDKKSFIKESIGEILVQIYSLELLIRNEIIQEHNKLFMILRKYIFGGIRKEGYGLYLDNIDIRVNALKDYSDKNKDIDYKIKNLLRKL